MEIQYFGKPRQRLLQVQALPHQHRVQALLLALQLGQEAALGGQQCGVAQGVLHGDGRGAVLLWVLRVLWVGALRRLRYGLLGSLLHFSD